MELEHCPGQVLGANYREAEAEALQRLLKKKSRPTGMVPTRNAEGLPPRVYATEQVLVKAIAICLVLLGILGTGMG